MKAPEGLGLKLPGCVWAADKIQVRNGIRGGCGFTTDFWVSVAGPKPVLSELGSSSVLWGSS